MAKYSSTILDPLESLKIKEDNIGHVVAYFLSLFLIDDNILETPNPYNN